MTAGTSWFRPELDDPGPWEVWSLNAEEQDRLQAAQAAAADQAVGALRRMYGRIGTVFGAEALAVRLGREPVDTAAAFTLARLIAAIDYFEARAAPPHPAAGGMTNRSHRRRWERLRPHLIKRAQTVLAEDAGRSILWHSVLGRVPEAWIPVPVLQRSMSAGLAVAGPYASVEVNLNLVTDPPGGLAWLAAQTHRAIAEIEAKLRRGKPSLVELIRADEAPPSAGQVVIVFGLEKSSDGSYRFRTRDPGSDVVGRIDIQFTGPHGGRIQVDPETQDRSRVMALRCLTIAPVRPPLFGPRRYLFWLLPWRILWWLRRWLALYLRRR